LKYSPIITSPMKLRRPIACGKYGIDQVAVLLHDEEGSILIFDLHGNCTTKSLVDMGVGAPSLIQSGPENGLLIVEKVTYSIYFINSKFSASYCLARLNDSVTAIYFEKRAGLLYCGYKFKGGGIDVYNISINSGSHNITFLRNIKTNHAGIEGLCVTSGGIIVYSSIENDSVNIIKEEVEKEVCSHGRGGRGKVRRPGCILELKDSLVVCDRNNYLLQFLNHDGTFSYEIGGKGGGLNNFDLAESATIVLDRLIVADMNNDRIISFSTEGGDPKVLATRKYIPGHLSRPTSIVFHDNKFLVCDRANGIIQIFDSAGTFVKVFPNISKVELVNPTSVGLGRTNESLKIYILERGSAHINPRIIRYDCDGQFELLSDLKLNDPQGMIITNEGNVVISDTLNRRAVMLTSDLKFLKDVDLALQSGIELFLCRVPSYAHGLIYFPDHQSGITLIFNNKLEYSHSIEFNLCKLCLSALRKIVAYKQNLILLGRGEFPVVETDILGNLVEPSAIQKMCQTVTMRNPADAIALTDDEIVFCDKENDRVIKYLSLSNSYQIIGA
jgi:hypothetical protein